MPSGQRIRNLRSLLGWTQRQIAMELGVSPRTVLRHERGQRRTPWLRLPVLLRLRQLESDHAEELIAYFTRAGRERA
jgi:transcriptional regulator with XRE-family HTH domain